MFLSFFVFSAFVFRCYILLVRCLLCSYVVILSLSCRVLMVLFRLVLLLNTSCLDLTLLSSLVFTLKLSNMLSFLINLYVLG